MTQIPSLDVPTWPEIDADGSYHIVKADGGRWMILINTLTEYLIQQVANCQVK